MIYKFKDLLPIVDESCFLASSAEIIGDVILKKNSSVWFKTVIRADGNSINIGMNSNIQDNCTLHVDKNSSLNIGNYVTVGHNCVLHGCYIEDCSLIGMGSVVLNGAKIGKNTIIGAGSLVTQNKEIPSGVLCMGSPAKVVRNLTEKEKLNLKNTAKEYVKLSNIYRK